MLIKIRDADATPPDFVFIARPDAARSGPNRHAILPVLGHLLHDSVEGKNNVRAIADGQLLADVDAGLLQFFHLVDQRRGIDHHAVADDGLNAGPQNAARNQLENELPGADEDGVSGVVAPLVASHD